MIVLGDHATLSFTGEFMIEWTVLNPSLAWLAVGLCLLCAELISGSFYLILTAMGAFAAALVAGLGGSSFLLQVAIAAGVSFTAIYFGRAPLKRWLARSTKSVELDIGQHFVADQELLVEAKGRLSYQGSTWEAKNMGSEIIQSGDTVEITSLESNRLLVKKYVSKE